MRSVVAVALGLALVSGCKSREGEPAGVPAASSSASAASGARPDRDAWNRMAVRLNLPVYWVADKNKNGRADRDEVRSLLFYPGEASVEDSMARVDRAASEPAKAPSAADEERLRWVGEELDQGRVTLVESDLKGLGPEDKAIVRHVLAVAKLVDALYATQTGMAALASQVPQGDALSQSLFRRNWGTRCLGAATEKQPACSAIPGAPKQPVDVYPAELQRDPKFCEALGKLPNATKLLEPFVVVRQNGAALEPVPYSEAYKPQMSKIADELRAMADEITSPGEAALKAYVAAAAKSFTDNDWRPADEAWARMNAQNSKFYLRVGPDETYWEPCSQKAGFHVSFARINPDSLSWQEKLTPVQADMERALADLIGAPYTARKVSFHLPDFIDIVLNAGDDRAAIGFTIGQSLPNWGPVANEGRGRTVAMSNLGTDPDTLATLRKKAESVLTKESLSAFVDAAAPGLLSTILHEATHNLGPAHEYAYKGKKDTQAFGGQLASVLEELKAQSGALYFVDFTKKRGIISPELAGQAYTDCIVWAFGHIAEGMVTATGDRKTYSQLAAIQVGFLMDQGAITYDAAAPAANGTDKGAFTILLDKLPAAVEKLMQVVGAIKANNDKAGAEALVAKYVDGPTVPQKVITERLNRYPRGSLVYSIEL